MTVTTDHNRIEYVGNAATTVFPYDFLLLTAADLLIYHDGVLQLAGFSISGLGLGSGGNVTYTDPPASGVEILFLRATDRTQQVNLIEGDRLPAESVEGMFDKLYALAQDLWERTARALKLPVTSQDELELPDPSDPANQNKALFINGSGDLEMRAISGTDIASPITAKGDLIQGANDGTPEKLGIGLDGQQLVVVSGKAAWATASDPISKTLLDAKGDLITATGADTPVRKAVGATGAILTADAAQSDGLLWTLVGAAGSLLRVVAGLPSWLAPGTESQVLAISAGAPAWVNRARVLDVQNGSQPTGANLTETDAFSYSLPAATLATLKDHVRILVWGITAANGNAKRYRVYFGSTVIYDSTASAQNNSPWYAECVVWRTGAATQDAIAYGCFHLNGVGTRNLFTQPTETLSGAITIRVTIQNSSAVAADITGKGMMTSFVPAP